MPKRQTILYTSNDAPRSEGAQLYVYYCKYSGKHAFTTGVHACCCCARDLALIHATAAAHHTDSSQVTHRLPTMLPAAPALDVDIDNLPRRRTDNARILDRNKYTVKLYTSDGGTKLLRRPDGKVWVCPCWVVSQQLFLRRTYIPSSEPAQPCSLDCMRQKGDTRNALLPCVHHTLAVFPSSYVTGGAAVPPQCGQPARRIHV